MAEELQNLDENLQKEPLKLNNRQIAYSALRKQGLSIADASRALEYNERYGYELEKKLKNYDLTEDYWLKKASKALKCILDGRPFGEVREIKGSTVVEVAKMVYDRHQPVVHRNLNVNVDTTPALVDLSKYLLPEDCNPT